MSCSCDYCKFKSKKVKEKRRREFSVLLYRNVRSGPGRFARRRKAKGRASTYFYVSWGLTGYEWRCFTLTKCRPISILPSRSRKIIFRFRVNKAKNFKNYLIRVEMVLQNKKTDR